MPKVSIIITTYNCEKYLNETINSAITQSERDLEILVIDDASTDGTLQIALDAAKLDDRIQVHARPHGGKPSITRNAGLGLAQGDYICFLDGDDLYAPTRIARQSAFLDTHPEAAAVFHDVKLIDETGGTIANSFLQRYDFLQNAKSYLTPLKDDMYLCSPNFYIFMALHHSSVHTSSIMLRRSIVTAEHLRFAEDVKMAEDIEFWWAIARKRALGYLNVPLSSYRIHGGNMTRNSETLYIDSITVHRRNFAKCADVLTPEQSAQYRRKIADAWFTLGYFCFCNGRAAEARGHYRSALQLSFEPRFITSYLKTFAPQRVRTMLQRTDSTS